MKLKNIEAELEHQYYESELHCVRAAELGWAGKEGWLVALTLTLTLAHKSVILGSSSPDYRVKIRPKEALMVLKRERGVPSLPCMWRERGVEGVSDNSDKKKLKTQINRNL